ncbi:MAG: hypothetical protein KC619_29075, partial [Myxococcales bacterium]|nr:hypothetical protein [Myxococcales bacterium]
ERALEKEPEHRPADAGAFLELLRGVTSRLTLDETVPAAPVAPPRWDDESEEPVISSDFPIQKRQADIPTHVETAAVSPVATSAPPQPAPNRMFVGAIFAGAMLLVALLSGAVFLLFAGDPDPVEPMARAPEPSPAPDPEPAPLVLPPEAVAEPAAPEPAVEAIDPEAVPEGETPPEVVPEGETPPDDVPAETRARTTATGARRGDGTSAAIPADPYAASGVPDDPYGPAPTTRSARRAPVDVPEDPYASSPLNDARACMQRNDRACAIRALEGRARTAEELEMLIELYRSRGNTTQALDVAERYLRRYGRRPRAAEYRAFLRQYNR